MSCQMPKLCNPRPKMLNPPHNPQVHQSEIQKQPGREMTYVLYNVPFRQRSPRKDHLLCQYHRKGQQQQPTVTTTMMRGRQGRSLQATARTIIFNVTGSIPPWATDEGSDAVAGNCATGGGVKRRGRYRQRFVRQP